DVLAYAPSLTSGGANIIPVANQNFSGWNTYQGSQVTITQGQPALATTTYFHMDHLSNRVLTDSSGNSSGQQGHYPFGESWYAVNSTSKWVFTSYERDAESGNDYALARIYASRLARFSQKDPLAGSIDDPQSLNRYTYARNMPTVLVDPSGMKT